MREKLIDIDNRMSTFKTESEISKINANASIITQTVSKDTYWLIKKSIDYSNLSQGTFDPTIRPLVSLWGVGTKNEKFPTKKEIEEKVYSSSGIKNSFKLSNNEFIYFSF